LTKALSKAEKEPKEARLALATSRNCHKMPGKKTSTQAVYATESGNLDGAICAYA